jgi:hypothetical protein
MIYFRVPATTLPNATIREKTIAGSGIVIFMWIGAVSG